MTEDLIRISVGTEHIDDIIHDFEQSFTKSKAAKPDAPAEEGNKEVTVGEGKQGEQGTLGGAT